MKDMNRKWIILHRAIIVLFLSLFVAFIAYSAMVGGNFKVPVVSSFGGGQKFTGGALVIKAGVIGQSMSGEFMEGGSYRLIGGGTGSMATFSTAKKDLTQAHCYPNPFKPSVGHKKIRFTQLTHDAEIKIYTISGELVKTLKKSDSNDYIDWDVRNEQGSSLASGVYLYIVKSASQKKKGKLMIIK